MRLRRLAIICLLLASCKFIVSANGEQKESLLIGPGDMLHVQVFDTPELEQHVRVTDDGKMSLLMGGSVEVSNRTPAEAARIIENALRRGHFLLRPQVSVTVDEYATQQVTVLGEVKSPSAYSIDTPRSILDVLAMAGGLTDLADRRVTVERHGSKDKVSYFISNSANVAVDTNVMVNPGDTVIVPKAELVFVLGDVGHPGGYTMTNNSGELTVLQLIARAGGTNHTSVPSHAKLIHKDGQSYAETALPLSDMQKGKRRDMTLQANDIIYVPFSYMRNLATQGSGIAASAATAVVYHF